MEKKQDLRVKKTKAAIYDAFIGLLDEKGYGEITVKDISERAMVNRKTFYFHYDTKEDLYNEIMKDILDAISQQHLFESLQKSDVRRQQDIIISFLKNIKERKRECLILMNDGTNSSFNDCLKERLRNALISEDAAMKRLKNDNATFQLLTDVYFETFTRVLRWWLESGSDDPLSFIEMVVMLFSSKPLEMLGLKEETLSEYENLIK